MTPQNNALSDERKEAMAKGRSQSRAVRAYLEALEAHRPKRGRKRTPESIKKRLSAIDADLPSVNPLKRLQLTQERLDLEAELESMDTTVDISDLEQEFIAVADSYAASKGISYQAFRELGVSAAVLKAAGVSRSR